LFEYGEDEVVVTLKEIMTPPTAFSRVELAVKSVQMKKLPSRKLPYKRQTQK
jgi:hypothetical protein